MGSIKSVYKWVLNNNGDVFAYIVSEDSDKPFIYNSTTQKRIYSDSELTKAVNDSTISERTNSKTTLEAYTTVFNAMKSLVSAKGYSISFKDANAYWNYDSSACFDAGNEQICPEINFIKTITLEAGESAKTTYEGSYIKPDGTKVFQYSIGVPMGYQGPQGNPGGQGPQGMSGLQGVQGATGELGKDGEDGADGVSPEARYTSTIFKRGNNLDATTEKSKLDAAQPATSEERSPYYDDPMYGVIDLGWSDGVPSADTEGNKDAILWMSNKIFTTSSSWTAYTWSVPVQATDSKYVDYEWNCNTGWTIDDAKANLPLRTNPDDKNPGCYPFNPDSNGWYDEGVSDAIFMAMCKIKNGEYEKNADGKPKWEVSKIKGEDGDLGEPLHLEDSWEGDKFYWAEYKEDGQKGERLNEAHTCKSDNTYSPLHFIKGHIYTWDGDSWEDGGMFNGEGAYLHIKYANETTGTDKTADNYIPELDKWLIWNGLSGETPNGEYTGLYTDNNESDELTYKKYKWTYSKGKDGFGYEYVYCAVAVKMNIEVPVEGDQYAYGQETAIRKGVWTSASTEYQNYYDFIPKNVIRIIDSGKTEISGNCINWRDDLISPTQQYPYVYQIYRRRESNGNWSKFIGATNTEGKEYAALHSIYFEAPDFKSTIFKRSNELYDNITAFTQEYASLVASCGGEEGGTYDRPVPTNPAGWTDGIPSDSNEILWMSQRTMSKEPARSAVTDPTSPYCWSKPVIAADNSDMEFEWNRSAWTSFEQILPPKRISPDDKNPGCDPFNPDSNGWYDDAIDDAVWMAQCKIKGGVYEQKNGSYDPEGTDPNWVYTRVKGEKGEKGDKGEGGTSTVLDLTNELVMVALGNDLDLDVTEDVVVDTTAFLYYGDDKKQITAYTLTGIEEEISLGKITYTAETEEEGVKFTFNLKNGLSFDNGSGDIKNKEVSITVYDENDQSYTKVFTIGGVKGGIDGTIYRLVPSCNAVPFDNEEKTVYNSIKTKVYFGKEEILPNNTSGYCVYYSIGTTPHYTFDESVMSACTYDSEFWYFTRINYKDGGFYFYLIDTKNNNFILDRESIPYIKDGKDGAGSIKADLSNEMAGVELGNEDNALNSDTKFETYVHVWSGDTKLNISNIILEVSDSMQKYWGGASKEGIEGKITYSIDLTDTEEAKVTIRFWGTKNSGIEFPSNEGNKVELNMKVTTTTAEVGTLKKIFTVVGIKGGKDGSVYALSPSVNYIRVKNGITYPSEITCDIKLGMELANLNSNFKIYYNTGDTIYTSYNTGMILYADGRNSDNNPICGSTISKLDTATEEHDNQITFYYVSGNTTILDRESVPYIKNGKDGAGYVVGELDNDSETLGVGSNQQLDVDTSHETTMSVHFGTSEAASISKIEVFPCGSSSGKTQEDINASAITIESGATNNYKAYVKINLLGKTKYPINFKQSEGNDRRSFNIVVTAKDTAGDEYTSDKVFTLIGLVNGVDGEVYRLRPSVNYIKGIYVEDKTEGKQVIQYSPTALTCNALISGKEQGTDNIRVSFNNDTNQYKYSSVLKGGVIPVTGSTYGDITSSITFYYYSGDSTTLLDKETVPVINDGKDGNDGEGYVTANLDNEVESIGVGDNEVLESAVTSYTTLSMYLGSKPVESISRISVLPYGASSATTSGDMYTRKIITVSYSVTSDVKAAITIKLNATATNTIDFSGSNSRRQFNIVVYGNKDGSTYHTNKIFTILGVKSGADGEVYRLEPSINVFKVYYGNNNTSSVTPSAITCTASINGVDKGTSDIWVSYNRETPITKYSDLASNAYPYSECVSSGVIPFEGKDSSKKITENITFYYTKNNSIIDREIVPVVYNGKNGINTIKGDIDNEVESLCVGQNEVLEVCCSAKTTLSVFDEGFKFTSCSVGAYGDASGETTADIEDFKRIIISKSSTGYSAITITVGLKGSTADPISFKKSLKHNNRQFKATAYGTYNGNSYEINKVFSIIGLAEGEDGVIYRISCDSNYIKYNPDTKKYTPEKITFSGKKGTETTGYTFYEIDNSGKLTQSGGTNITSTNPQTSVTLYLYNTNSTGSTLLDKESIPVIWEGKNGISTIKGDLDNDVDSVGVGDNETLDIDYSAKTTLTVFDSGFKFTSCTVSAYGNGSGKTNEDISALRIKTSTGILGYSAITITIGLLGKTKSSIDFSKSSKYNNRQFKITAKGTYNDTTYTIEKIFTIIGLAEGKDGTAYRIVASSNYAKYNPNTSAYTPSALTFEGQIGGNKTGVTYYSIDKTTGTGDTKGESITLTSKNPQTSVTIFFYDTTASTRTLLDKETIPIIWEGKNGESSSSWLEKVFGEIDESKNSALLRGYLGVEDNEEYVRAYMNASQALSDGSHGIAMLVAGIDHDVELVDSPKNAKFRVFEDGALYAENATINGVVESKIETTGYTLSTKINAGNFGVTYTPFDSSEVPSRMGIEIKKTYGELTNVPVLYIEYQNEKYIIDPSYWTKESEEHYIYGACSYKDSYYKITSSSRTDIVQLVAERMNPQNVVKSQESYEANFSDVWVNLRENLLRKSSSYFYIYKLISNGMSIPSQMSEYFKLCYKFLDSSYGFNLSTSSITSDKTTLENAIINGEVYVRQINTTYSSPDYRVLEFRGYSMFTEISVDDENPVYYDIFDINGYDDGKELTNTIGFARLYYYSEYASGYANAYAFYNNVNSSWLSNAIFCADVS